MNIFKKSTNIDFTGKRNLWLVLSIVLSLIGIASLAIRGLNLSIDYTGGTLVEVGYDEAIEVPVARKALEQHGYNKAIVQHFGTVKDIMIRLPLGNTAEDNKVGDHVLEALRDTGNPVVKRVEYVGPQVGKELFDSGIKAALIVIGAIVIYVWLRFEWKFAVGAIVALFHDAIVTLGFLSITGAEFDLSALAAVLAVLGYSINDTIVVYDRIRETFRKTRKAVVEQVINASVNQTLSRTIMTSFTTMFVAVVLFFFGGDVLRSFSLALIVGIIVGTYSSIYIAGTTLLLLKLRKEELMPVEKEGGTIQSQP